MSTRPSFLADVMLGTLAKWLRILGYDTEYDNQIDDDAIVARCLEENRIALTRDSRLVERRALEEHHLLIRSQELRQQIHEVLRFLGSGVDSSLVFTRCVECNEKLSGVRKDDVIGQVPPYVYRTQRDFKRCPRCQKVYWRGTHREKMLNSLMKLPG